MAYVFTDRRREASRANLKKAWAAHCAGRVPRPERPNNLKHSFFALDLRKSVILLGEDVGEYDAHVDRFVKGARAGHRPPAPHRGADRGGRLAAAAQLSRPRLHPGAQAAPTPGDGPLDRSQRREGPGLLRGGAFRGRSLYARPDPVLAGTTSVAFRAVLHRAHGEGPGVPPGIRRQVQDVGPAGRGILDFGLPAIGRDRAFRFSIFEFRSSSFQPHAHLSALSAGMTGAITALGCSTRETRGDHS